MFPSLNPTAHLRSDTEMELLSKAVLWRTDELWFWVSDGTTCTNTHAGSKELSPDRQSRDELLCSTIRVRGEKHCFSQERAAHFPKALSEPVFICNRELRVALCSAWQSEDWCRGEEWSLVFPSLTRSQIHLIFSDFSVYSSFACHEYYIFIDSWLIKSNSSNRVEECSRINVCINGSQTFSRVPHEIRLQPWLVFPEPQRGVWKSSQREKLLEVYMKRGQKV